MEYKIITESEFKKMGIELKQGVYSEEYFNFIKNYYIATLHFMIFEEKGEVFGILPLADYKQNNIPTFGTLPKTDATVEFVRAFDVDYNRVADLLKKHLPKPQTIQLRIFSYHSKNVLNGLTRSSIIHAVAKIESDNFFYFFDRKNRNQVRQSLAGNFEIKTNIPVEAVYNLYLENMKRHSTPPKALGYFEALKNDLKGKIIFMGAFLGDKLCGVNIFYVNNDYLLLMSNLSSKEYWHGRVNNFLYFKTIEYGYKNGVRYFDYGPSTQKDLSHLDFKTGFGGELFGVYEYNWYGNSFVKLALYLKNKSRNIKMRIMKMFSKMI